MTPKPWKMKTVLKRLGIAENAPLDKFRSGASLLMILFFLMFGALSLVVLLNSAA